VTQASDNVSQSKTLLARVAAILGIDQQTVENAFAQAQRETQEEALDNWLKKLVDEGKITQAQADEYKQWWQSRPDMSQYQQQLKEWQEARPNIPELGPGPGFGGRGFRGGMDWGGGRGF
jgi:protein-disulfide isomerase-like protein with CxxC motif